MAKKYVAGTGVRGKNWFEDREGDEGKKVVEEVVETQPPKVEVETGGVKDLDAIKAGVPKGLTEDEKKARDEHYQEFKEDARKRADYLLEVVHPRMREMEGDTEFMERMVSDKDFRKEYNGWKTTEEEILSKDEELRGLTLYKEFLGEIIGTSDDIKAGRTGKEKKAKVQVKKGDIPELLNSVCREAVEKGRLQKVSREVATDQKHVVYNTRYGENDEIYMPKPDTDMWEGAVTPATIGIVDAILYLKGLAHKYGPTNEEMRQKRIKVVEKTLAQRRQKMKDRCSDIPMSQIKDRDGVLDKTLLYGEYDTYTVQQGTKKEHEIPGATFCVRVVIPRIRKGEDVVLGEPQIVPVEALESRGDTFVEMMKNGVSVPVYAINNKRFEFRDRDEKKRKLKIILTKMIEAVMYQYKLEHTPQKPKVVKTAKKIETAKVTEVKTPKPVESEEVDLLDSGCGL